MKKIFFVIAMLALTFSVYALPEALAASNNIGNATTISSNTANTMNFDQNNATATLTVDGNYSLNTADNTDGITAAYPNQGIITYDSNFTTTGSIYGQIGVSGSNAINQINMNGTGNLSLTGAGNIITANGLDYGANGTVTIASGKNFTGNIDNTSGTADEGILTLAGGSQTVTGTIGSTKALNTVNIETSGYGNVDIFTGAVNAATINLTTTGNVSFEAGITGNLNFTNTGGSVYLSGDINGNVDNTSGTADEGTLTAGGGTITGTIGNTKALNAVLLQTAAGNTETFSGAVNAENIDIMSNYYFGTTGTAIFAAGIIGNLNFTSANSSGGTVSLTGGVTGNVDNTSGTANEGTLTLAGGSQTVTGTIGNTQALNTVNADAGSGNTDTFSGAVNAATVNLSGNGTTTGTAAFAAGITGNLNFTSANSSGGTVLFTDGITGSVANTSGSASMGTLTLAGGSQTVTGTVGSAGTGTLNAVNVGAGSGNTDTFDNTVNAATINITNTGKAAFLNNVTGTLQFSANGTATVANGESISGNVSAASGDNDIGTLTFEGATTTDGYLGTSGNALSAVNFGDTVTGGAVVLQNDIYAANTTINTGSTVTTIGNRTITGALTLANASTATLNIGTTTLTVNGVYTQGSGSTLDLTVNSSSSFGSIITSTTAAVNAGSTINVTVGGNIPNKTTFDIIDTEGSGIGSAPLTVTSTSSLVSFSDSILNGDLILTADALAGFSSLADNPNAQTVGTVLDNITNPSSDMTTVLNTLESLSNAQITSALNTMGPIVDGGVRDNSYAILNNFVGASIDRAQSVLAAATVNYDRMQEINKAMDKVEPDYPQKSSFDILGVSSGDESKIDGIWAKDYGSYLDQGTRQGIQGYNAWNAGTAVGYDRMLTDSFTLGVSGGYAYGNVDSDANNGITSVQSAQSTIYAGYQDANIPYFIDTAGSFAWNWYNGSRNIEVGPIDRTAKSDYDGQQYGAYLDGGYKFNLGNNLELTPLASIQWDHLTLGRYTETNAGALDLSVDRQNYDMLESGVGAKVSSQVKYDWGNLTPEVHAKWLYDFIEDDMAVTSTYTGGGASFISNGAKPAKEGVDVGGKLSFDLKNDISLIAECGTEMRDGFFDVYGSATARYKF